MKNKRILTLLVLLIVILLLGIGYAINVIPLEINGTAAATASQDNFVVKFIKEDGENIATNLKNATAEFVDDTHVKIDVTGLTTVGDKATATYTVKNESKGINANVAATATITNDSYFKVTTEGLTTTDTLIEADNTQTITVTVELLKTPIEAQNAEVTVSLTATPVAQ